MSPCSSCWTLVASTAHVFLFADVFWITFKVIARLACWSERGSNNCSCWLIATDVFQHHPSHTLLSYMFCFSFTVAGVEARGKRTFAFIEELTWRFFEHGLQSLENLPPPKSRDWTKLIHSVQFGKWIPVRAPAHKGEPSSCMAFPALVPNLWRKCTGTLFGDQLIPCPRRLRVYGACYCGSAGVLLELLPQVVFC